MCIKNILSLYRHKTNGVYYFIISMVLTFLIVNNYLHYMIRKYPNGSVKYTSLFAIIPHSWQNSLCVCVCVCVANNGHLSARVWVPSSSNSWIVQKFLMIDWLITFGQRKLKFSSAGHLIELELATEGPVFLFHSAQLVRIETSAHAQAVNCSFKLYLCQGSRCFVQIYIHISNFLHKFWTICLCMNT